MQPLTSNDPVEIAGYRLRARLGAGGMGVVYKAEHKLMHRVVPLKMIGKDLTGKPTWGQLPAVKAGQILGWPSEPIFSYDKCAAQIEALTKAVTTAKKVS